VQNTDEIWRLVDAKKGLFEQLSDQVWDTPELCYTEFQSCAEHTALLELQGFPRDEERRRHPHRGGR
jgi:aminobenzoyl-glutamate utilization protein B